MRLFVQEGLLPHGPVLVLPGKMRGRVEEGGWQDLVAHGLILPMPNRQTYTYENITVPRTWLVKIHQLAVKEFTNKNFKYQKRVSAVPAMIALLVVQSFVRKPNHNANLFINAIMLGTTKAPILRMGEGTVFSLSVHTSTGGGY